MNIIIGIVIILIAALFYVDSIKLKLPGWNVLLLLLLMT